MRARMQAARATVQPQTVQFRELEGLPAPVQPSSLAGSSRFPAVSISFGRRPWARTRPARVGPGGAGTRRVGQRVGPCAGFGPSAG